MADEAPSLWDDAAIALNLMKYVPRIAKMAKAIQASTVIQDGFVAISEAVTDYHKLTGGAQAATVPAADVPDLHALVKTMQKHLDGMSPEGSGNFS